MSSSSSNNNEQQQPQLYRYSSKVETTAKGLKMVTVHVYGNDLETVRRETTELITKITNDLKANGYRTADFPNADAVLEKD